MASYIDAYIDAVFAFTPPSDHCVAKIYGARTSSPTNIPDVTNLIATSAPADPPWAAGGAPAATRFTFAADPPLTPGDPYWVSIERTGANSSSIFYRAYFDSTTTTFDTYRSGSADWVIGVGPGWGGTFVLAGTTMWTRSLAGGLMNAFGEDGSTFFVEEFTAPAVPGSGARIWRRI